jgi:hypothetical protein
MDDDWDFEIWAEELRRDVDAMLERSHQQMAASMERLRISAESAIRAADVENRMIRQLANWRLRLKASA